MQKVHYDQWLSGGVSCGRQNYDYASEDISKVTCKDCLRANKVCGGCAGASDPVESCGSADEREDSNPLFYGSR